MKVLLLQDVYQLGHAGEVKKVADGYARNYLIPRGLATLATPGALAQADRVRAQADAQRAALNAELGGLAAKIAGLRLTFAAKAGETGKLYGSITHQQIAEAIEREIGEAVDRRHIAHQPIKLLGEYTVPVRLTADLVPTVKVVVHREGESPAAAEAAEPGAESARLAGGGKRREPAAVEAAEPAAAPPSG